MSKGEGQGPLTLGNAEVARALSELADLLDVQGANSFRVQAYRNAVRTLTTLGPRISDLIEAGVDLQSLPGIGRDLADQIEGLLRTGRLRRLDELAREVPRSLTQLLALEGLGPKKVQRLWTELGITTVDELEQAVQAGRLSRMEGFGVGTVDRILRSLAQFRRNQGRLLLSEAEAQLEPLLEFVRAVGGVSRAEAVGSLRRRKETVRRVAILAVTAEGGDSLAGAVASHPSVETAGTRGSSGSHLTLRGGPPVALQVVPPTCFGAALHHFTGSEVHSLALRRMGLSQGVRIDEWGIFRAPSETRADGDRTTAVRLGGETEEEVFAAVGLPWIPPELRENRGEIEAARGGHLPRLVSMDDIQADLHMHSRWSDGRADILEMARACQRRGYQYAAITDHSPSLGVVDGLSPSDVLAQRPELDRASGSLGGFPVFHGLEVDILPDGSLDMTDEVLDELDLVLVAVHGRPAMRRAALTDRIIQGMQHPRVDILCHPTGRKLAQRDPHPVDVEAILEAAADLEVAVELNANPRRLDLGDVHVWRAKELGVKVAINSDAHSVERLDHMRFGVDTGRRGWLEPGDVLNTLSIDAFRAWLDRRSG